MKRKSDRIQSRGYRSYSPDLDTPDSPPPPVVVKRPTISVAVTPNVLVRTPIMAKGMVGCSVCSRTSIPGVISKEVSFHPFPEDRVLRKSWVDFVNKPGFEADENSTICSVHFNVGCFKAGSLKPGSVPTQRPAGTIEEEIITPKTKVADVFHRGSSSNGDSDEEKIKLRKTIEEMRKMMAEWEQDQREKVQGLERTMKQLQEDHKATVVKLENQIDHLKNMDIIKSKKIRKVQIKLWGQRNRAKKLTAKLKEFSDDATIAELEDMYVVPSTDEDES